MEQGHATDNSSLQASAASSLLEIFVTAASASLVSNAFVRRSFRGSEDEFWRYLTVWSIAVSLMIFQRLVRGVPWMEWNPKPRNPRPPRWLVFWDPFLMALLVVLVLSGLEGLLMQSTFSRNDLGVHDLDLWKQCVVFLVLPVVQGLFIRAFMRPFSAWSSQNQPGSNSKRLFAEHWVFWSVVLANTWAFLVVKSGFQSLVSILELGSCLILTFFAYSEL